MTMTTRQRITECHTAARLYPLAHAALNIAIAEKSWGRVASLAQILELTEGPCVDRLEDVNAIMQNHVLRLTALELILT